MKNKHRIVYTGMSMEDDLRAWLLRLCDDLEKPLRDARTPASTSDTFWNVPIDRARLRAASDVVRRVASIQALAQVFPEQLAHRPKSGHRYWLAVDVLLEQKSTEPNGAKKRVANRWRIKSVSTVDKIMSELGDAACDLLNGTDDLCRLAKWINDWRIDWLSNKK